MNGQENIKQAGSKPKKKYTQMIFVSIILIFVLWLFGLGYLINNRINSAGISNDINYVCEKTSVCAEKNICGYVMRSCISQKYEPLCMVPESPDILNIPYKVDALNYYENNVVYSENTVPIIRECICSNNKCTFNYRKDPAYIPRHKNQFTRLDIETVWNNTGKIALVFTNAGLYTFNDTEAASIKLYIAGVDKSYFVNCSGKITTQGTVCPIETDVDFPNALGNEAGVKIEVKPPFGQGDIHLCALQRSTNKYC